MEIHQPSDGSGSGGEPALPFGSVQFNDSGSFGGFGNWNDETLTIDTPLGADQFNLTTAGLGGLGLLNYDTYDQEIHFGMFWDGSDYIAKDTTVSGIFRTADELQFYINDGNTVGMSANYGPSRLTINGVTGALTFNGAYTFPTTDGTMDYVLSTDGSGVVSWAPQSSGGGSPGGSGTNLQYRLTGSTFGGIGGSVVDNTLQKLTLVAADTTIAAVTSFTATLVLESLISPPSDSPSILYGPTTPSGGFGTENPGYSGYQPGDSVDAYVFSYIIDPRDGTSILVSGNVYNGNVTMTGAGGIDWSGWSGGSGAYLINIINNTQGTNYTYDIGGSTSYADMNVGGSVTYSTFSGISASGYSYDFQPYNKATSPASSGIYISASGGDFTVNDDSSGNQYWVQHSITGNSGVGWLAVELYDVVSNTYFETSLNTYYQTAQSGASGFPPYVSHYGFLSDGSTLTVNNDVYATDGLVFSSSPASSNTTDPNDAQYYYWRFVYDLPTGAAAGKLIANSSQGQVYSGTAGTNTNYRDVFTPFSAGTNVSPSTLSSTPLELKNSSDSGAPTPQLILNSTAGSNPTMGLMLKNNSTIKGEYNANPSGDLQLVPALGRDIHLKTRSGGSSTRLLQYDSAGSLKFILAGDGALDVGATGGTNFWATLPISTTSRTQILFAQSSNKPTSPIAGGMEYDGALYITDSGSQRRMLMRLAAASPATQNTLYKPDSNGNFIASSLIDNGSTLTVGSSILAQAGIAISSSQNITMGSGSAITGGLRTTIATTAISTSLNQANHSPWLQFTGSTAGRTLTLPTAASVSGIQFGITNLASVSVTIATTSSQNINLNGTTATTLVLQPGDSVIFIANASSAWDAFAYYQAIRTVASGGTGNTALGALTKTDDTNVTLTLGGSPSTALVNAASLTLGWTGTLSVARGGTGLTVPVVTAGSFSGVGTATTTFTVTIGITMANTTYKVNATPTDLLAAAVFYINNKTTTTFDVVYLAGLTGTVTFDWSVFP